jgi:hypothetical protein
VWGLGVVLTIPRYKQQHVTFHTGVRLMIPCTHGNALAGSIHGEEFGLAEQVQAS